MDPNMLYSGKKTASWYPKRGNATTTTTLQIKRLSGYIAFIFMIIVLSLSAIPSSNINTFTGRFQPGKASFTSSKGTTLSTTSTTKIHSPHPKARNVRIHFLNHHFGTSSEMIAIAKALMLRNNVDIQVKESWGVYEIARSMTIHKDTANKFWPTALSNECNAEKYDIIISADTMPLVRPHLQNCCTMPIVSLLTTRFDWGHGNEPEWAYLVGNATRWNNFRIYPNNKIEDWYANWRNASIIMQNYLPSSGVPSILWSGALKTINYTTSQPDDNTLILPTSVRTEECLSSRLDALQIKYTTFGRNKYGGPLGLTDRIVVHFPYQSNTMSLFENLHQRVIYVLPTLRLFREMGSKCEARIEQIPNTVLTDEEFYENVDWWRKDLQHLFFYFDTYEELRQGSLLRKRIVLEADEKRVAIGDFMLQQKEYVLSQWEDILFEEWHVKGKEEPKCLAYKASSSH